MANPARAYLATQVETTSQGELLIMLYEAAIKFLKRAKIEIENKDYAKKGIYISKAMAIIHELSESLNKEKGGEITPSLLSLYQFCTSQLIKANIRMDTKRVDDVIKILDGIRSAYAQIVPQEDAKSTPATISAQAQATQAAQIKAAAAQAQAEQNEAEKAAENPASAPAPKPQTKYGRPMGQRGYGGLGAKPFAQPRPQAAPTAPDPAPTPVEPAPPAPPAPEQQAAPEPPQSAPPPPAAPEPAQPTPAPKLRTAFNAAKFRAANAYTNNS